MIKFTVGVNEPAFFWCLNQGFTPSFVGNEEGSSVALFMLDPVTHEELLQSSL